MRLKYHMAPKGTILKFHGNKFCGSQGFKLATPTSGQLHMFLSNRRLVAASVFYHLLPLRNFIFALK